LRQLRNLQHVYKKNNVLFFNYKTGDIVQRITGNKNGVTAFTSNSTYIAAASVDILHVYTAQGKQKCTFKVPDELIVCLTLSENKLLSGGAEGSVILWNVESGTAEYKFKEEGSINLAIIKDTYVIVSYGTYEQNTGICVYDLFLNKKIHNIEFEYTITCLQLLNNTTICVGCSDGGLSTWDFIKGEMIEDMIGHKQAVLSLSANDLAIVSGGADYCFKIWDPRQSTLSNTIEHLSDPISSAVVLGNTVVMIHGNIVTLFKFHFNMTEYYQRFKARYIAIAVNFCEQTQNV